MRIYTSDHFVLPLPTGHRFPIEKYALLHEAVAGYVPANLVCEAPAATEAELRRAHDADYVARVLDGTLSPREQRTIGFPWSPAMAERSRRSAGATLAAARHAITGGRVGISLAGGTHHAFADHGEGYCVFNDTVVAIANLAADGWRGTTLVVDLDVHQGNGTAAMLAHQPGAYTLSVHGARNFPFRKTQSDWDVELPDGTGDDDYLAALGTILPMVFAQTQPDLVFYLAGADVLAGDRLGRLALTPAGVAARDTMVFDLIEQYRAAMVMTMAGGYAEPIANTVAVQAASVQAAWQRFCETT
ncbi:histone deacetylase [Chitinimonas sp. BJYL2]|uniref:histone deacetylase family protein n=1 Tax=Chitinimonas sp. BJYL2 TaxID=2976696 RepID=UPI0022B4F57A|nr:histone deacetylase [Chitinimonas sp. BJYL2]